MSKKGKFPLLCEECNELRLVSSCIFYRATKIEGKTYRSSLCFTHANEKRNMRVSKQAYIKSMYQLDRELAKGSLLDGMGIYKTVNVFKKYNLKNVS